MKNILIAGLILALAGCGGVHRFKSSPRISAPPRVGTPATVIVPARKPRATGPISTACLASDRKARSRELCGCIQAVADQTLNGGQQRRAAKFYKNPQEAQDIRMSDRASHETFWDAYVAYGKKANKICR